MFSDPHWQQLHTKIARYIAPYDAVAHSYSLDKAKRGSRRPKRSTSRSSSPSTTPSTRRRGCRASRQYQHDVQKFVKLFPHVRQYQSWNEANRGNIRGVLASPSASRGGAGTTRR